MNQIIRYLNIARTILGFIIVVSIIIWIKCPPYDNDIDLGLYYSTTKDRHIMEKVDSVLSTNPQYTQTSNLKGLNIDSLLKVDNDYSLGQNANGDKIIMINPKQSYDSNSNIRSFFLTKNNDVIALELARDKPQKLSILSFRTLYANSENSNYSLKRDLENYKHWSSLSNSFESNFLNQIGEFKKENNRRDTVRQFGIYSKFFTEYYLFYLGFLLILIIIPQLLKAIVTKEIDKIYLYVSIITFILPIFLPVFEYIKQDKLDFGIYLLTISPFGIFDFASKFYGIGIMCLANICYYISIFLYIKNNRYFYFTITIAILSSILLFHPLNLNYVGYNIYILKCEIGYYVWIISFFILLFGRFLFKRNTENYNLESINSIANNNDISDNIMEYKYPFMAILKRLSAFFIDLGLFFISYIILARLFNLFEHYAAKVTIVSVLFALFLCRDSFTGQGVGKRVMKLEIIRNDGSSITPLILLYRNLLLILGPLEFILLIILGKRFGDIICKCSIIELLANNKLRLYPSSFIYLVVLSIMLFSLIYNP